MLLEYVAGVARQMKIPLSKISVVKGEEVGCLDVYLLHLDVEGKRTSVLIHQSELDDLQDGAIGERLEMKIKSALLLLQMTVQQCQD